MDTLSISAVVQFLICAGIVWLGATNIKNSERLVRIETLLRGEEGQGGIVSEISGLRDWKHRAANDIQIAKGAAELLDLRVSRLEESAR